MVVHIMPYKILAYGHTDKGLVRDNNEDVWGGVPELGFFALADGMGGHRAGEVASRESILSLCQLIEETIGQHDGITLDETTEIIGHIIKQVNAKIYRMGALDATLKGMGTTLCCLQFHDDGVICVHVGDSRIYRLRNKALKQVTADHSLLRELIDLGQISESQASDFTYRNILTKGVGTEPKIEPTFFISDLQNSDTYLMCSDGLSDMLSNQEIEELMNQAPNIKEAVKVLVAKANERGGVDNITVVIMQVENYEKEGLLRQ